MSSKSMKSRLNGFQWPPSRDQLKTVIIYPIISIGYYLLICATLLGSTKVCIILICLNGSLSILLMIAWVTVEYIDPQFRPGKAGIPVVCFPTPEKSARFCGACRKTVSGLDHHCTWLNTCVGRRNYVSFICLVFIGATQCLLQTVVGVCSLTLWIGDKDIKRRIVELFRGSLWGFYLIVSIYTVMSGLMALGLLVLASFHSYLMLYVKMGTYDWLLHRRGSTYDANVQDIENDPDMSGRERLKQKQREEWQKVINNPRKAIRKGSSNHSSHSIGCIDQSHQISVNVNIYNAHDDFSGSSESHSKSKRNSGSHESYSNKNDQSHQISVNVNIHNSHNDCSGSHESHSRRKRNSSSHGIHTNKCIEDNVLQKKLPVKSFEEKELEKLLKIKNVMGKEGGKEGMSPKTNVIRETPKKKSSVSPCYHPDRKEMGFLGSNSKQSSMHSNRSSTILGILGVLPVESTVVTSSSYGDLPFEKPSFNGSRIEMGAINSSSSGDKEDYPNTNVFIENKSCSADDVNQEPLNLVIRSDSTTGISLNSSNSPVSILNSPAENFEITHPS